MTTTRPMAAIGSCYACTATTMSISGNSKRPRAATPATVAVSPPIHRLRISKRCSLIRSSLDDLIAGRTIRVTSKGRNHAAEFDEPADHLRFADPTTLIERVDLILTKGSGIQATVIVRTGTTPPFAS